MKLSFMTNILTKYGMKDLEQVTSWAEENGFDAMEVGPTFPLDQRYYETALARHNMKIAALTYCRNFLSSDEEEARHHLAELRRRIVFAGELGVPLVVTSTGIDKRVEEGIYDSADSIRATPARSLDRFTETFLPVVELASRHNVKIAFENCPLMGNIAISPVMWRRILERLDAENVGLAYDPSHLVWQHIEPYRYISEFAPKIFHVHAKDMHVNRELLEQTGFLTDFSWWSARIPGRGDIDWQRFTGELRRCGYQGAVSIEHEDTLYEGSLDRVLAGLTEARDLLRPMLK